MKKEKFIDALLIISILLLLVAIWWLIGFIAYQLSLTVS